MKFGLGTVLFLIFLVLKLVGTINWSWWWVTSPLWIVIALALLVLLLGLMSAGVVALMTYAAKSKR